MCIYIGENIVNQKNVSHRFKEFFLIVFTPFLQLHDHAEPLLPHVHGAGLDLLCVHDCEEHRAGEGAASQGDSQNHGG